MKKLSAFVLLSSLLTCTLCIPSNIHAQESMEDIHPIQEYNFQESGQLIEYKADKNSTITLDAAYINDTVIIKVKREAIGYVNSFACKSITLTFTKNLPESPTSLTYKENNVDNFSGNLTFQESYLQGNKNYIATYTGIAYITLP